MKELPIKQYTTPQEAALYGGYALNKIFEDTKNQPLLLALSGGSALELLDGINPENLGEHLTVTMLDDRFSTEADANNFLQLQKTDFYKTALDAGASFYGTLPRPAETKEQLAERWENNLKTWRRDNPDGKILATLGMGVDGHAAGLLPFPEDEKKFIKLFLSPGWVTAYDAAEKNKYPLRITTTITFLKQVDNAVAYICGHEKQVAFDRLKQKANKLCELPAMIFWDLKNLEIYTDLQ